MFIPSSDRFGCALDGAHVADMGAATAQIVGERSPDFLFARLLVGLQQIGGLHDHAVDAVAALHGLLTEIYDAPL